MAHGRLLELVEEVRARLRPRRMMTLLRANMGCSDTSSPIILLVPEILGNDGRTGLVSRI
jgi:hypothetical protein